MLLKRLVLIFLCGSLLSEVGKAQQLDTLDHRYQGYIELEKYMVPFWKASQITDETLMVLRDGKRLCANLLFEAKEIISVKSTDQRQTFVQGKDWDLKDGKLVILDNTSVPIVDQSALIFKTMIPGMSMTGNQESSFVLFKEGLYFQSRQLSVTYIPKKNSWNGPKHRIARQSLRETISKLQKGRELKISFYGNSIERGYNTSGYMNGAPFMPSWPELMVWKMRSKFQAPIQYSNVSVPGKLASWGQKNAMELVAKEKPDLVIIGFGMNDGAEHISPESYQSQIKSIMDSVKSVNAQAEFILISPMLANPNAIQSGGQATYLPYLKQLSGPGVAIADMTGVHTALLKVKSYQDMTGNNVNHPNDYLARWYAQTICSLMFQ